MAASLGWTVRALIPYRKVQGQGGPPPCELAEKKDAKVILVTAISPTPAGEGKTTTSVGLADALHQNGQNVVPRAAGAQPRPRVRRKGGAAGGGMHRWCPWRTSTCTSQAIFTPSARANNLLAAMVDKPYLSGNALNIDPRRITWKRCVDMNDRQLRFITDGLGGKQPTARRVRDGFDITVVSEVMAIFCLATDLADLKGFAWAAS